MGHSSLFLDCCLSICDLQSGQLVTFNNSDHSARQLADGLLTSASIPVLMNPVSIRFGGKTAPDVDGGLREFLPLRAVFDSGIELDHIIAISTAPLEPKRQNSSFNAHPDPARYPTANSPSAYRQTVRARNLYRTGAPS